MTKKKGNIKFSIMTKMFVAFFGLTISSLIISGYISLRDIQHVGQYALESSMVLSESATNDSANALRNLGIEIIQQKAKDISVQCEIYIKTHHSMSINNLQSSLEFRAIAVQSVGDTGYTLLYEKKTGMMRFHPNPELINFDSFKLSKILPSFCRLIEKTLDGSSYGGFYDWQEPDRKIRQKYMYMVPIKDTNYMVAATTYIDEFLKPVKETKKKIASATIAISDHLYKKVNDILKTFIKFFIILAAIFFGISLLLSRTITRPIRVLTEGVKAIGRGDLAYKVNVGTRDEFEELAISFNKMTSDLTVYIEKLHHTTAEQEHLRKELEIARKIQQSILPKKAPEMKHFDIAAINLPAREVGGDFYDFIPVCKNHLGLIVADVSGKGMPAAIFMGLSRTIVRASTTGSMDITHAIRRANELICRDSTSGMFVTLFYGVIDESTMNFRYINAGHNPPLLFGKSNGAVVELEAKGIPLGVIKEIDIEEQHITLSGGNILALYTDGITEAPNEQMEEFGTERLINLIQENRDLSAQAIIQKAQDEITMFSGKQPQYDDITLMIIKVE